MAAQENRVLSSTSTHEVPGTPPWNHGQSLVSKKQGLRAPKPRAYRSHCTQSITQCRAVSSPVHHCSLGDIAYQHEQFRTQDDCTLAVTPTPHPASAGDYAPHEDHLQVDNQGLATGKTVVSLAKTEKIPKSRRRYTIGGTIPGWVTSEWCRMWPRPPRVPLSLPTGYLSEGE